MSIPICDKNHNHIVGHTNVPTITIINVHTHNPLKKGKFHTMKIVKTLAAAGAAVVATVGIVQPASAKTPDIDFLSSDLDVSTIMNDYGLDSAHADSVVDTLSDQSAFDDVTTSLFDGNFQCPANIVLSIPATANSASFIPEDIPFGLGNLGNFGRLTAHPNTQVKTVPYNASWWTSVWSYNESRDMGIAAAHKILSQQAAHCPNAKFHFYGYSEGSDVASALIDGIAHGRGPISPEQFGSASLIANPTRNPSAPHTNQIGSTNSATGGFFPARDYGMLTDKVRETCNVGDVVCDTTPTAGHLYHEHVRDAMSNTALFRGKFTDNALFKLVQSLSPDTALPAFVEVPASVLGWIIHISSYLAGGFDQGTRHIEANLA